MLTTYYTYRALAGEWNVLLSDKLVAGAYSSGKNELVIHFTDETAIVFGYHGRLRYLFRSERSSKPRRNVVALLPSVEGLRISGVEIAHRDRIMTLRCGKTVDLVFLLFGARPNVMVTRDGEVVDAFKFRQRLVGGNAPVGQPARETVTADELASFAGNGDVSNRKAVATAFRLMDATLASEVVLRCGLDPEGSFKEVDAELLFGSAQEVVGLLVGSPKPRIYWRDGVAETFSLIELSAMAEFEEETFDTVDLAVSVFCRRRLAQGRLSERRDPVLRAVDDALQRAERRTRELAERLSRPSRADAYERWGHLLMASGRGDASGMTTITLDDMFEGSGEIEIPLKEDLSVIENAQDYYGRA
ncbi:MAG: NFACT family protein, partial [Rhodothermales bacterium]|nr:NFACT family protein [Rhodothermales bacterium]